MFLTKVVGIVAITAAINAARDCSSPASRNFCPSGWRLWQHACYRLTESKANWDDSKGACREMGGKMAAPRSLEEMKFITELARERNNYFNVWIACNDKDVEGVWTCDGQRGGEPFLEWAPGEPNNAWDQDCAGLRSVYDASTPMDDFSCLQHLNAFCVRQAACSPCLTQPHHHCSFPDTQGHTLNSACLLDHVIREFITGSVTACGSACVLEPGCRSFNIKENDEGKKVCQLNNSTSSEDKDNCRNTSYFCIYSEMSLD